MYVFTSRNLVHQISCHSVVDGVVVIVGRCDMVW